jgi:hypothetical protein
MRQIKCKDGTVKTVADNYTLQHGESLVMPAFMMDHGNGNGGELDLHRPGYRYATDALTKDVDAAFNEMVEGVSNAWRQPSEDEGDDDPPQRRDHRDAAAARAAAYADYVNILTSAWRRQ